MKVTLRNGNIVEIRAAKVSDAKTILDCMTLLISESKNLAREPEEWKMDVPMEEEYLAKMIASPHEYMAIAVDNGRVIATAGIHGKSLSRLKHRVGLGISVLQAYHHQGLGTQMMNHVIEMAKRMGKRTIELDVRKDNINAIKLYEKVGFYVEGIKEQAFFVDGNYVDLVLMAKHL